MRMDEMDEIRAPGQDGHEIGKRLDGVWLVAARSSRLDKPSARGRGQVPQKVPETIAGSIADTPWTWLGFAFLAVVALGLIVDRYDCLHLKVASENVSIELDASDATKQPELTEQPTGDALPREPPPPS
jgi:hypothetical protein